MALFRRDGLASILERVQVRANARERFECLVLPSLELGGDQSIARVDGIVLLERTRRVVLELPTRGVVSLAVPNGSATVATLMSSPTSCTEATTRAPAPTKG